MSLTRELLEPMRRDAHPDDGAPLHFHPRCHPRELSLASYRRDGILAIQCGSCGALVAEDRVATAAVLGAELAAAVIAWEERHGPTGRYVDMLVPGPEWTRWVELTGRVKP